MLELKIEKRIEDRLAELRKGQEQLEIQLFAIRAAITELEAILNPELIPNKIIDSMPEDTK